jgi:hypothetical protein
MDNSNGTGLLLSSPLLRVCCVFQVIPGHGERTTIGFEKNNNVSAAIAMSMQCDRCSSAVRAFSVLFDGCRSD